MILPTGQRAEDALRESEDRYRTLIENANEAIFVIQDGRISYANPKLEEIGKFTAEELAQKSFLEFVHPDDRIMVGEYHKRRLTGEPLNNRYVFRIVSKEGSVLWIEINASLITWNGRPAVLVFLSDITERKRSEEALRESEEKFRTLVENSLDGILIVDMTGTILFGNRAASRIIDAEFAVEMFGTRNVMEFVAPESRSQVLHDFIQVGRGIDSYPVNYQIISSTGRQIWAEAIGKRIMFQNSPAILVSMRDISSRKRMEEAIHQANKKLALLSDITRHDMNNQLLALNGFVGLLQRKIPDPSFEDYFSRITKASSQIAAMIEFTKEYESIGLNAPAWQDCRTHVDTAIKQAPLGNVTMNNDLPPGAEVFADPLIVKVFYNLMDNAVRYGGKITTVRFSAQESGNDHLIICEDDGNGIPADEKERIFERGFGKNTGLGLFLAREILNITGITIQETGTPGEGARFEMTVPKGNWRITAKEI